MTSYCATCDHDNHVCKGCGRSMGHSQTECPCEIGYRIQKLLDEVFHAEAHEHWMNHPMRRFNGQTPQQLVNGDRGEEVAAYLDALAEGVVM